MNIVKFWALHLIRRIMLTTFFIFEQKLIIDDYK